MNNDPSRRSVIVFGASALLVTVFVFVLINNIDAITDSIQYTLLSDDKRKEVLDSVRAIEKTVEWFEDKLKTFQEKYEEFKSKVQIFPSPSSLLVFPFIMFLLLLSLSFFVSSSSYSVSFSSSTSITSIISLFMYVLRLLSL